MKYIFYKNVYIFNINLFEYGQPDGLKSNKIINVCTIKNLALTRRGFLNYINNKFFK